MARVWTAADPARVELVLAFVEEMAFLAVQTALDHDQAGREVRRRILWDIRYAARDGTLPEWYPIEPEVPGG
jgi:hypothetical protein